MGCNAGAKEVLNFLFVLAKNYKKISASPEAFFGVCRVVVKCYIGCDSISLRSLIIQTFNKNKLNFVCFDPKRTFSNQTI